MYWCCFANFEMFNGVIGVLIKIVGTFKMHGESIIGLGKLIVVGWT